jgi:TPP-dependent pyruvate/acetoin dehydrogenase alpha subunit
MKDKNIDINPLEIYSEMTRIRLIEEEIARNYSDQEMRCPVHLSVGQEATAVGACAALTRQDVICSTHRSHAHYLAKGGSLQAMLGEIYGRTIGCCGGRGGSMHLFDQAVGVLASVPIVGSTIPLGVGAALAFSRTQVDHVALVFLGDGATEEGVFHESLNFASVRNLNVIFFVENNLYSCYTPLNVRQPPRKIIEFGKANGLRAEEIDGNDPTLVLAATREMVEHARTGGGPSLIVANTYRWLEHCGPNYDDDLGYRDHSEVEEWIDRCPIKNMGEKLRRQGILNGELESAIRDKHKQEYQSVVEIVRSAPFPKAETAQDYVYA